MRGDLFARRLSEMLHLKRMKGKDLAEKLGVSARTVSRWVTGAGGVPLNRLPEIYEAMDVTEKQYLWPPHARIDRTRRKGNR